MATLVGFIKLNVIEILYCIARDTVNLLEYLATLDQFQELATLNILCILLVGIYYQKSKEKTKRLIRLRIRIE